jgi:signal transduction histidine kinase
VEVEISDTGSGIVKEDLPHIFDRFYRADKSRSLAGGNTGLGLAIAQKIVELHGSDIEVESEKDVGTMFRFSLPVYS